MARYPSRAPLDASEGGVAAVDRALMLMKAFGVGERALSLQQLAERTGMVKSTMLRLLLSLQHFSLVHRLDDGQYALGPGIARLYGTYISSFSLDTVIPPVLRALVAATQESASFHVRQGDVRLLLFRVNSPQPLSDHSRAGDLFPLERGSGGRVILAFSGARGEIYDRIRKDKVIGLIGERVPDLAGISSPVFQDGNHLVGALTLTMPKDRYRKEHLAAVRGRAAELSRKLGGDF